MPDYEGYIYATLILLSIIFKSLSDNIMIYYSNYTGVLSYNITNCGIKNKIY